jgi:hypothetical protein
VNASQSRRISARSCSIFARAIASLLVMIVHTRRCTPKPNSVRTSRNRKRSGWAK